jgi:hypothetical protein
VAASIGACWRRSRLTHARVAENAQLQFNRHRRLTFLPNTPVKIGANLNNPDGTKFNDEA